MGLGFSKIESRVVGLILACLFFVTLANLLVSLRRARDVQRKSDVRTIYDLVERYKHEFGNIPLSKNDKFYIPTGELDGEKAVYQICDWGYECLPGEKIDRSSPAYLGRLPVDPQNDDGVSYLYKSDGKYFQIYASLEGRSEDEFNRDIETMNIKCGSRVCNYGLASDGVPLDKTLEEFRRQQEDSFVVY